MKTLRFIGMTVVAMIMCFCLTACGGDDDDDTTPVTASIVGSWEISETNSDGSSETVLITFNRTLTGAYTYTWYDKNGNVETQMTQNFEYAYDDTNKTIEIIGDSNDMFEGTWYVTLTATKLRLSSGGYYWEFTKR